MGPQTQPQEDVLPHNLHSLQKLLSQSGDGVYPLEDYMEMSGDCGVTTLTRAVGTGSQQINHWQLHVFVPSKWLLFTATLLTLNIHLQLPYFPCGTAEKLKPAFSTVCTFRTKNRAVHLHSLVLIGNRTNYKVFYLLVCIFVMNENEKLNGSSLLADATFSCLCALFFFVCVCAAVLPMVDLVTGGFGVLGGEGGADLPEKTHSGYQLEWSVGCYSLLLLHMLFSANL